MPYRTWTSSNATWRGLNDYQRAAAMSIMEAGNRLPEANNVLGAIVNRAQQEGQDLGKHVSRAIYQPTIEKSQEARLNSIVKSENFDKLTKQAENYWTGKEAVPHSATHFLVPEKTMVKLEAQDPAKYKNWGPNGANWTGYDPKTGEYSNVVFRDPVHAFLNPDGVTQVARAPSIWDGETASVLPELSTQPQSVFDGAKMVPTGWAGSDVPQIITAGPNAAAARAPTGQDLYDSLLGFANSGNTSPASAALPPSDNALHNAPSQAPTTFDARFQGAAPPPATLAERFAPAQFDQSFQDRATFANLPPDALTQTKLASLVQPQSGSPFDAVTRGPEALAPWQTAGQGFQPAAGTSGLVGVPNQTAALPTMADVPLSQPAQPKPLPPVTQTAQAPSIPLPQSKPADLFAQNVWANGPDTGNMAQDFNQQEAAIKNGYAPWNPQLGGSQQNAPNLAKLFSGGNPFEQGGAFGNGLLAKGINAFNGNPDPNSPIGKLASLFGIGTGDIANLGGFGGPGANGSLDFGNSFSTKTPSSGIDAIKKDAAERLSLPGQSQNPLDALFGKDGLFSGMSNGLNDLFGLGNNSLGDMSNIFDGSGFVNGMGNGMDTIGFGDFGFGGDGGGISPASFGFGAFA